MTYPASLLVHSAELQTGITEGSGNIYGKGATLPVVSTISCRFGMSETKSDDSDSGFRVIKSPQCIVPAGTVTKEGYTIKGLTAPFLKTYRIKTVDPVMLPRSVSHIILTLEEVS